ncbi:MAG: choice-of-anchor V domain-containing protein, partial [Ignavibacteriaceae bacterium]
MQVLTNLPVGKAGGKFLLTTMFLSVVVTIYVFGYQGGITGRTQKNGIGCTCHSSSASTAVSVVIDGPESLLPGQTETYTVTISGGPLVAGGTNIAASEGTLAPGTDLRLASSELTHQSPKTSSNGKVVFSFTYTAPAAEGSITLYANGNSVNHDGTNSNDQWNFAQNKTVNVSSAVDI